MASIQRWKRHTLSAKDTPLDYFDPSLTPCPDGLRRRCLGLIQDASLDLDTLEDIEHRIQSPELTEAEGLRLVSYLEQHKKQVHEYYAPTQRMITNHIKKICGL